MKFERSVVEIDLYGTPVKLRKPSFAENQKYRSDLRSVPEGGDTATVMKDFVSSLGMSAAQFDLLEIDHVTEVMELIYGSKKK